jgi:hemoglobin
MPATLYERLGGGERIQRLVTDVVENHYNNPLIRARFANSNRPEVERHVFEFLCAGSGGPQCYTGKDLVTAHKGMNINEQELVAAIDDILKERLRPGREERSGRHSLFIEGRRGAAVDDSRALARAPAAFRR